MDQLTIELNGTVVEVKDTEVKNERFQRRDMIIEVADNPQYPQYLTVRATQGKCGLFDNCVEGSDVTAHVNLQGKKYERDGEVVYYNVLSVWKIYSGSQRIDSHQGVEIKDDLPF